MNGVRIISSRAGAVYVEFLLVVLPMLALWLGLTQIGLMYGVHLLVGHAAARAARAAIVILPDDAEGTYAEEINTVGNGASGGQAALDNYAGVADDSRLRAIGHAAAITLSPVMTAVTGSLEAARGDGSSVGDALRAGGLSGPLGVVANYLTGSSSVAVTFPDGPERYRGSFGPREPITVRVTMLYKCSVPLVAGLVCRGVNERAQRELDTVLPLGISASEFGASFLGVNFIALTAERTLPNQGI